MYQTFKLQLLTVHLQRFFLWRCRNQIFISRTRIRSTYVIYHNLDIYAAHNLDVRMKRSWNAAFVGSYLFSRALVTQVSTYVCIVLHFILTEELGSEFRSSTTNVKKRDIITWAFWFTELGMHFYVTFVSVFLIIFTNTTIIFHSLYEYDLNINFTYKLIEFRKRRGWKSY